MTDENDDGGPFFRIYALSVGHVLTPKDVDDIQQVLADYNEEIGSNAELYHQGRVDAFREIGGDALVAVMEAKDSAISDAAVKKALALFYARVDPIKIKKQTDLGLRAKAAQEKQEE